MSPEKEAYAAGKCPSVDNCLSALKPPHRDIVATRRQLLGQAAPKAEESLKWGKPCYAACGLLCYIASMRNHVNVGFYKGTNLEDLDGLLEGTGKGLRHVKLYRTAEINRSAIKRLIKQAVRLNSAET